MLECIQKTFKIELMGDIENQKVILAQQRPKEPALRA